MRIIAPDSENGDLGAAAGAVQGSLLSGSLARAHVVNIVGARGMTGLRRLAAQPKRTLLVVGPDLIAVAAAEQMHALLQKAVPIARLAYGDISIFTPRGSPYRTIDDLLTDVEQKGRRIAIAGRSWGGVDHLLAHRLLALAGIPGTRLRYVEAEKNDAFSGRTDWPVVAAITVHSWDRFGSRGLRVLATAGRHRTRLATKAPTLREAGLNVVRTDWRGLVAAPNTDGVGRDWLLQLVTAMRKVDSWRGSVPALQWREDFVTGAPFSAFLDREISAARIALQGAGLLR